MKFVLWSISNPLRGFSLVIVEITSHSVSAEYQCHTYPRLWLQHCCMDSVEPLNLLCCCLRENLELSRQCGAVWERTWKQRQGPEMDLRIPKVFHFVGLIMKQVLHLSCWYESWEMISLLPHLHSYGTKDWKTNKPSRHISSNLNWNIVIFFFPLQNRLNLFRTADSDILTIDWSWLRVTKSL